MSRLMPPGPPGIPLLGNALQVPYTEPWHVFRTWKEQYGEPKFTPPPITCDSC